MNIKSRRIEPSTLTILQLSNKYEGAQALTIRLIILLKKILKTERLQNRYHAELILDTIEKLHSLAVLD